MPQKATLDQVKAQGETETAQVILLSEAAELFTNGELDDAIVIVIPDTGKARFNPAHTQKKDASKTTKACFVIAEIGGSFAGEAIEYRQSQGDAEGLPLTVKLSVVAQAPNKAGKTVQEALNRTSEVLESASNEHAPKLELARTGTDN